MSLVRLVYVSSATQPLRDAELARILESSVRHNRTQGITGMLLYLEGTFMQVLEGEDAAINETFERICEDDRHHDVFLLQQVSVAEREFSRWHMSFCHLTPAEVLHYPEYAPIVRNRLDFAALGIREGLALDMLRTFYRQNSPATPC